MRRGALCAELFPDQYAELNPSERPAWTRKDSKNREPFGAWRENPDEKCHRPATLEEPCNIKPTALESSPHADAIEVAGPTTRPGASERGCVGSSG